MTQLDRLHMLKADAHELEAMGQFLLVVRTFGPGLLLSFRPCILLGRGEEPTGPGARVRAHLSRAPRV